MAGGGGEAMADDAIELFHDAAFDPETVAVLCVAYDRARKSMHDTGQPRLVYEVIARRIVKLAEQGERDPDRLCADAISAIIRDR
jgi:hypothetical protein